MLSLDPPGIEWERVFPAALCEYLLQQLLAVKSVLKTSQAPHILVLEAISTGRKETGMWF